MYINKKTGELVEATFDRNGCYWLVWVDEDNAVVLSLERFNEQYEKQSNLSKLMLPKSELDDILQTGGTNRDYFEEIQVALLNHLAKSEFNLYRYQGADIYIPLSDYLKEGK